MAQRTLTEDWREIFRVGIELYQNVVLLVNQRLDFTNADNIIYYIIMIL